MSRSANDSHRSVMVEEMLSHLLPRSGEVYCDATLGAGGHAERILLASAPDGRVIGIDRDEEALREAGARLARFGDRFVAVHGRFGDIADLLRAQGAPRVHGIVADLGISSPQLSRPERGFSFQTKGPIDMRMDQGRGESALELIQRLDEDMLTLILRGYGEERHAGRIARAIKRAAREGALTDTLALSHVIARAGARRADGRDPATRSFQALRIAVNDELGELDRLLHAAPECLLPGGRLVVISFHSLEDRVVKHRLRGLRQGGLEMSILTKKAVLPSSAEVCENPRARSARLRAALCAELSP